MKDLVIVGDVRSDLAKLRTDYQRDSKKTCTPSRFMIY